MDGSKLPPQTSNSETIRVVITQPASEMPENGYPVVFYGHGVGNNKEQSFPVATELAGKGIATVSIDWVAQGERAVKVPVHLQIVTLIRLSVKRFA